MTAVAVPRTPLRKEEEVYLATLAYFRLEGLVEHLDHAFREAHRALQLETAFPKEDLDKFSAFLRMILPDLMGTGTGDAFCLTQISFALEEPGHRFADLLHRLSDEYGCWERRPT